MSKKRHRARDRKRPRAPDAHLAVRTYGVTHPAGLGIAPKSYDWDQLVYASSGVMTVFTPDGAFVVPPHRAVFVPAGVVHAVSTSGRVTLRTLFFRRRLVRLTSTRAVNVPPLLRELILETVKRGMLEKRKARDQHLLALLVDCIHALDAEPLQLPTPLDARGAAAAALLRADPSSSTHAIARKSGASARTLERIFKSETAMTLGRWRQRLRMMEALKRLAAGQAVTTVALDVGYDSPSAFIHAFKAVLGATPRRYFA